MNKKINDFLYGDRSFALAHLFMGVVLAGVFVSIILLTNIFDPTQLVKLVNIDMVSLSATISGFELTGVTLLISLTGNEKLQDIKDIGSDKTIYKLFFYSIMVFVVSILLMVVDINLLDKVQDKFLCAKEIIEYISVFLFAQGFLFFISSVRMLMLVFK